MRFVLGGLILSTVLVSAQPVWAERVESFKIGNWRGGAYISNSTGGFLNCQASVKYRNDISVTFAVTNRLQWWMLLKDPGWTLRTGSKHSIEYWVDDGRVYTARATALSQTSMQFWPPADDKLFRRFRRGRLLNVDTPFGTLQFKLTSTNRMLSRLLTCARKNRDRYIPAEEVPPEAPPRGEVPPEVPPEAPSGNEVPPEVPPEAPSGNELPPLPPSDGEVPPEVPPEAPSGDELPPLPPSGGEVPPEVPPEAPSGGEVPPEVRPEDLPPEAPTKKKKPQGQPV